MLERGHIAGGIDRLWLHIFLVFMIVLVDIFSILVALLLHTRYRIMLVAHQDSTNKKTSKVVSIGPLALGFFDLFPW